MNFIDVKTGTDRQAYIGFHETSCVLLGRRRDDLLVARMRWKQTGNSHCVSFDWQTVLAREEARGDVLGFFHTHPSGIPGPSSRDDKTMAAWVTCFGKPLLCVIACDQAIATWQYANDGKRKLGKTILRSNGWLIVNVK